MKIGILTSLRKKCGIGIYSSEFIKHLRMMKKINNKLDIFIITQKDADININGVKVYRLIDENEPFYFTKCDKILKRENPDIIDIEWDHRLYSPLIFLGQYIFPLIHKYSDKILMSFHSLYKREDVEKILKESTSYLSSILATYYEMTKRFLIINSKKIRVFTYYELYQVAKYKKAILIPQGIKKMPPLKKNNLSNRINLLIFGFIRDTKNYELAISSLLNLKKRCRLLIVGEPKSENIIKKIIRIIKFFKVKDRVTLIPRFVNERHKTEIFKKSHIILLPYKLISNSGVLLDSIKYCRPVVSTVLSEDIRELKIGEYAFEDSLDFSQKICRVIENYDKYYESILDKRKNFFWPNIIKKIVNLYEEIS